MFILSLRQGVSSLRQRLASFSTTGKQPLVSGHIWQGCRQPSALRVEDEYGRMRRAGALAVFAGPIGRSFPLFVLQNCVFSEFAKYRDFAVLRLWFVHFVKKPFLFFPAVPYLGLWAVIGHVCFPVFGDQKRLIRDSFYRWRIFARKNWAQFWPLIFTVRGSGAASRS